MYHSTRIIICQIYIQRAILYISFGRCNFAKATQTVHISEYDISCMMKLLASSVVILALNPRKSGQIANNL